MNIKLFLKKSTAKSEIGSVDNIRYYRVDTVSKWTCPFYKERL